VELATQKPQVNVTLPRDGKEMVVPVATARSPGATSIAS
jgi:hypothetical protein